MLALLLAALAAGPALQMPGPSMVSGTPSPVLGSINFDRSGSRSWGDGIPAPTIDCVAGAAGALTCTGATATPSGTPATVASSIYPDGFSASPLNATRYDGSSYHDLGDVGDPANSIAVCQVFRASAGTMVLASKDGGATQRGWMLYNANGSITFYVFKANATFYGLSYGAQTLSGVNVICSEYVYVADGTSVMRGNLNGTAATEVTNAGGPAQNVTAGLFIGAVGAAAGIASMSGDVLRTGVWIGASAEMTAAQLAVIAATQRNLYATKPSTSAITWTRNSTETCCEPTTGVCWTVSANTPCVTSAGAAVFGAYTETLLQTDDFSTTWSKAQDNAARQVDIFTNSATTTDPWGGNAADEIDFKAVTGSQYSVVTQVFTATAAPWTYSVYLKGMDGSGTIYLNAYQGATTYGTACPFTASAWSRCSVTKTLTAASWTVQVGVDKTVADNADQPAQRVFVVRANSTAGAILYPSVAATTAAVSVPASVVSTPVVLTDPLNWSVSLTAKPVGAWQSTRGLFALGTAGAANSANLYFTTGLAVFRGTGAGDAFWQFTAPATSNDARTFAAGMRGGNAFVSDGGVEQALSFAGSPIGAWTMPSVLTIGGVTGQFNGAISAVRQCSGRSPSRCK